MFRITDQKKRTGAIGLLAVGLVSIMVSTGSSSQNREDQALVQIEQKEQIASGNQLVQNEQKKHPNIDLSVNPFIETTNQASPTKKESKNNRNLPAIPTMHPTSQPRPMLPLPNVPRIPQQNPTVVASAPAEMNNAPRAENAVSQANQEARIAFFGGNDIMSSQNQ